MKILHIEGASCLLKLENLRTVATNGKYFFPDNDYVRQVDHIRGYWNPKKKTGGNHPFFRDNRASMWRKTLNGHFLERW